MLYLKHYWRWCSTPMILVTMLYVVTDILLKLALNINTTDHHVIGYNWHIVGSGVQHQKYWSPCYTFICTTHCWKWHSTAIKLVTMLYVIPDIMLKVAFNTNKTGHHVYVIPRTLLKVALSINKTDQLVICYTWHIVESGVKHK